MLATSLRGASSFVGRADDLAGLREALSGGQRLITLLGPGGMGKTRLARELAGTMTERWPTRWFCDLSEAHEALAMCGAVARAIGIALDASTDVAEAEHALAEALCLRGDVLLVLDNFEQLDERAADVVAALCRQVPTLTTVVTSRERLRIDGELAVDLLALPEQEALQLFLERARAVRRGYDGRDDHDVIRAICRELDGLPLAIELAAARMRVLSAKELQVRLAKRFELLTAGPRTTAGARHATLRAVLDGSWDQLDTTERRALAQCSVFEGGFTLEAAEKVLDIDALVLDAVAGLRDKSLLWAEERAGQPLRFGMYVSVREYAREKLHHSGDLERLTSRHATHFLTTAFVWASQAEGHLAVEARERLAGEQDNLLAVHRRSLEAPVQPERALRAAIAVQPVLITQGPAALRLRILDAALQVAPATPNPVIARLVGWASVGRADCLLGLGRMEESKRDFERALGIAQSHHDRRLECRALWRFGSWCWCRGATQQARGYVERALAVARDVGEPVYEGRAESALGVLQLARGELIAAQVSFDAALAEHRGGGDQRWEGITLGRLAELDDARRGDQAPALYQQALALHRIVGDRRHEAHTLAALAAHEHGRGRLETALRVFEQALQLYREVADQRAECACRLGLGGVAAALGDHAASQEQLTRARGIAEALGNAALTVEAHIARIELMLVRGDLEGARDALAEARRHAVAAHDGDTLVALATARIQAETGDRGTAQACLDEYLALPHTGAAARRAMMRLERALAKDPPDDRLVIERTGGWLKPPGRPKAELTGRRTLSLVVAELAKRHLDRESAPLSVEAAFASGWPGERASAESATSRVYVAMSTLRKLGLKDALVKKEGGYHLVGDVMIWC